MIFMCMVPLLQDVEDTKFDLPVLNSSVRGSISGALGILLQLYAPVTLLSHTISRNLLLRLYLASMILRHWGKSKRILTSNR